MKPGLLGAKLSPRVRIEIRIGSGGRKGIWSLLLALLAAPLWGQSYPSCEGGKTALVLSGGGAKGLAHIPLLRLLDSLGAVPDLVVGTSIGSIVGALYASGYSGAEIDSIVTVMSPASVFATGDVPPPRPWRPFTPLLVWEQGEGGFSLRAPTISESRANALLSAMLLRGNLLARGNFDSLPIPYRAVATNLDNREPVVIGRGDLAQAARASMSIPLALPPVALDSLLLVDGGASANIPIGIARALGATRVIVSDVTGPLERFIGSTGPLEVAGRMAHFIFRQPPDSLGPDDVYVRVDVSGFDDLDFSPPAMDSLRVHGRQAADSIVRRASCLPRARRRMVAVPKRIGTVEVEGGIPGDPRVLGQVLGLRPAEALDEPLLRTQVSRLEAYDVYRAVWLGPQGGGDTVSFRVSVQRAAPRMAGLTFAYDNDLGGRLGLMYLDRHLFGTAFQGSGTLGLSRIKTDLTLGVRRYFGVGRSRLAPAVTGQLGDEKIILYNDSGQERGRPNTQEAVLFAGLERELGGLWVIQLGFDGRTWSDADTSLTSNNGERGSSGGALLRIAHHPGEAAFLAEGIWSGTFRRARAETFATIDAGRLTLIPRGRLGWGEFLPLQSQFPLGGDDGFPGFAVHQLRGDREVFGSVQASWALVPSVSIRLLVAGGRSVSGGALFGSDHWLGGARLGAGVSTPVGPVIFEYGVASDGSDQLFVRIGRWF